MSKLFEIVNNVINSDNLHDAEEKLFGIDGININSEEYFKSVISNFIKKKEHIIRKENNNLVFNLNNYNDIWNIVFVAEYIKDNDTLYKEYNNLLQEICNIEHKLMIIRNKHKEAKTREEHETINEEYRLLKMEFDRKNEIKNDFKGTIDTFYSIDWVRLDNTTDEIDNQDAANILKQSINIIHKLRNSVQHNNVEIGRYLEINNDNFNVSLPIEYLDGFTKGEIIAKEEDRVIVERTSLIASPLLESLGYDVKNVESFFYNVNPEYLNFLLEQVDYNYDELYKLTTFIYMNEKSVKEFLKKGIDLNCINKLPIGAFHNCEFTLDLFNRKVELFNWPSIAFKHPDSAIELHEMGIDISKLPNIAFEYPMETKMICNKGIDISKLSEAALEHSFDLIKLWDNDFNIYELPDDVFNYSESAIYLHNKGLDINKLPHMAFIYPKETIKLINNGINIYKLPIIAFNNVLSTIFLNSIGLEIYKLPYTAFEFPIATIRLYNNNINVYDLPDLAFSYPDAVLKLFKKGIDIYKIGETAFENPDLVIQLYDKGINIYEICDAAFLHQELIIRLHEKNIDINKLPPEIFLLNIYSDDKDEIDKSDISKSITALYEKGINIYELSPKAFKHPNLTIRFFEKGIDLSKITDVFFDYPDVVLSFFKEGINIYKLPERCYRLISYNEHGIINNIKYLLNLVDNNYDKLNEFPKEFFTCDIKLIEEMYKTYNLNITRSIFGINNPKLIATLIYCDNVFKKYQKENGDYDLINFDPTNFIRLGYENTLNFKNNISDTKMDIQSYFNQFVLDYDGNYRNQINIKNNILDKIRNSICHFRFKPVKDSNGKIVEDKIYLYDKFDNSDETNFNIILNLKDLVSIVRKIELDLQIKDSNIDNEINEENANRRNRV